MTYLVTSASLNLPQLVTDTVPSPSGCQYLLGMVDIEVGKRNT